MTIAVYVCACASNSHIPEHTGLGSSFLQHSLTELRKKKKTPFSTLSSEDIHQRDQKRMLDDHFLGFLVTNSWELFFEAVESGHEGGQLRPFPLLPYFLDLFI